MTSLISLFTGDAYEKMMPHEPEETEYQQLDAPDYENVAAIHLST